MAKKQDRSLIDIFQFNELGDVNPKILPILQKNTLKFIDYHENYHWLLGIFNPFKEVSGHVGVYNRSWWLSKVVLDR